MASPHIAASYPPIRRGVNLREGPGLAGGGGSLGLESSLGRAPWTGGGEAMKRCLLMGLSGLFERHTSRSAIGGKADIPR